MPKVSIIVPVYNVEKYLSKCLDSIVNQTLKDIEIICINDGSVDNSQSVLEAYAKKDTRIKVINQKNLGLSCARNKGIDIAQGEYIGFVDSDDWIDLEFYEELYNNAINTQSDIAASSILRKRLITQKSRVLYKKSTIASDLQEKMDICKIPKCCYVWNKIYKKELIRDNLFAENKFFEDVLWLPEIIKKSNKIVTVPKIKYYYRANKNSIVKKVQTPEKQLDSYYAKKSVIKFYEDNNLKLDKKYLKITKSIKYLFNFPIIKTKEMNSVERDYLFGSILIPHFISVFF